MAWDEVGMARDDVGMTWDDVGIHCVARPCCAINCCYSIACKLH